jgi:hypothetical protein
MKYLLCVFVLFTIYGCASGPLASGPYIYVPESVDATHPEDYATIKTESEHNYSIFAGLDHRVILTSLDGDSLFNIRWDSDYPEECYLTPGYHEISIRYRYMRSYATGCFAIYAEKGMQYLVKSTADNSIFKYWVEANNIGKIQMSQCKSIAK